MTDFRAVLQTLVGADVKFIVVGGVAAAAHGTARLTQDVDVVYDRDRENITRLAQAFAPHAPYLRGAPPGLPFRFDEKTIALGLNFTLTTDLGAVDLLGEIVGGGSFEALPPNSIEISVYGVRCLCLDLPALIRSKRAADDRRTWERRSWKTGVGKYSACTPITHDRDKMHEWPAPISSSPRYAPRSRQVGSEEMHTF